MEIIFSNNSISKIDEKIILISLIGTLESLKNNILSIDEAEKFLFSPHMIGRLRNKNCNIRIIDILEKGCELEDVASLIPEKLYKIINELEQEALEVIRHYQNFEKSFWINEN